MAVFLIWCFVVCIACYLEDKRNEKRREQVQSWHFRLYQSCNRLLDIKDGDVDDEESDDYISNSEMADMAWEEATRLQEIMEEMSTEFLYKKG